MFDGNTINELLGICVILLTIIFMATVYIANKIGDIFKSIKHIEARSHNSSSAIQERLRSMDDKLKNIPERYF